MGENAAAVFEPTPLPPPVGDAIIGSGRHAEPRSFGGEAHDFRLGPSRRARQFRRRSTQLSARGVTPSPAASPQKHTTSAICHHLGHLRLSTPDRSAGYHAGILCHQSVVEKPTYDTRGPRQTTCQTTYREKGSGRKPFTAAQLPEGDEKPMYNTRGALHRQSRGQTARTTTYRKRGSGRKPFKAVQLPEGELCAWESCTARHRKGTCFRSGQCHDPLPFKLYTEHRELYDSIEADRKKDCERLTREGQPTKYTPLPIPTEADYKLELEVYKRHTGRTPKSSGVNFVDTTGSADNASINCAIFGNAVNMINNDDTLDSPAPDWEHGELYTRYGDEFDFYSNDLKAEINSTPTAENDAPHKPHVPAAVNFTDSGCNLSPGCDSTKLRDMNGGKNDVTKSLFTGGSAMHNPAIAQRAANATISAHIEANAPLRSRWRGATKAVDVAAHVLLLAVATVSFLTPVSALGSLVSSRAAVVTIVGKVTTGSEASAYAADVYKQTLDGSPPLELLYALAAVTIHAYIGVLLSLVVATICGALDIYAYFWRLARRAGVVDAVLSVVRAVWRVAIGLTSIGIFLAIILATKGIEGAPATAAAAGRITVASKRLGIEHDLGHAAANHANVVAFGGDMTPRLTEKDAVNLAMSFGAGGATTCTESTANVFNNTVRSDLEQHIAPVISTQHPRMIWPDDKYLTSGTDGIVVPSFDDDYDPTAPLVPSMAKGETIQHDGDDDEYPGLLDEDDPANDKSHTDIQTPANPISGRTHASRAAAGVSFTAPPFVISRLSTMPLQQQQPRAPRNTGAAARRDDSTPTNPISGRTRDSRAAVGVSSTAPPFVISPLSPMFSKGAFPAALHAAGGDQVATIAVDTKVGDYAHDITRENVTEQLVKLASDPRCIDVLTSFPFKTWSTARFNQPGPPLLRDIEQPEGILNNEGNPPSAVLRPNAIITNGTRILRAAHAHGDAVVNEAPPTNATGEYAIEGREGYMYAAMWTMPPLVDFSNDTHAEVTTFDLTTLVAAFDIKIKRETDYFVGTNVEDHSLHEMTLSAKTCHRSRHVLHRFFNVREWQHDNELVAKWIVTSLNTADMLTKSTIAPTTFTKFKEASMHIVQPAITFVNAIRVVIGMHASPMTWKAKLYVAE